jgi:hypothetical protein
MKDFSSIHFKMLENVDEGKWAPSVGRDWAIIVIFVFTATAAFVAFNSYLYFIMTLENFYSGEDSSLSGNLPEKVRIKDLDMVISSFNAKKESFDSIINTPAPFSDPSVVSNRGINDTTAQPTENIDLSE